MIIRSLTFLLSAAVLFLSAPSVHARQVNITELAGKGTSLVAVVSKKGAEDYTEYAEGLLKERLQKLNFKVLNKEQAEKAKKDRLLMEAIKNQSASAMVKISSEYGASLLVRGTLQSVASHEKMGSWEGGCSLSLQIVDTKSGEEVINVVSEPMGTSENPAPMEDSSLAAKQMAISKAVDSILTKVGADSETLSQLSSITANYHSTFPSDGKLIKALAFSPDNSQLLAALEDQLDIYSLEKKEKVKSISSPKGNILALAFSRDGSTLVAGTKKGFVIVWSWPDMKVRQVMDAHSSGTQSVDVSPDGKIAVSGGGDGKIKIWDLASGRQTAKIDAHDERIVRVSFDAGTRNIVSVGEDLFIRFWDINTKKETRTFKEPMDRLEAGTLSKDKTIIAYAAKTVEIDLLRKRRTDKRYIRLRDQVSGRDIFTFEGHFKDITDVAFFPGRRFVASGSSDKTIKVWDIEKRGEVASLDCSDKVTSMAISNDGKYLAGASSEIQVWKFK